jgi:hypothetical protein
MRFIKCFAASHGPTHLSHMLSGVMHAMTLQRRLLALGEGFRFFHYDRLDFLPAHFQRLRESLSGLLGLRAAFGFFFICPKERAQ